MVLTPIGHFDGDRHRVPLALPVRYTTAVQTLAEPVAPVKAYTGDSTVVGSDAIVSLSASTASGVESWLENT
jgi:hypothetical protein